MISVLEGLNEKQRQAVTAPLGPVLVLAGAGSGKTKVLTHRIAYLISEEIFSAENILALTFTNKAAKEMQSRIQKLVSSGEAGNSDFYANRAKDLFAVKGMPIMGTFHSICAKILRNEIEVLGYTRNYSIYDDDDQSKVIKEICTERNLGSKFSPSLVRNYISQAKNILQTPEEFNLPADSFILNIVREIYFDYQNYLFKQNALDFDDLLMLTVKIFEKRKDILQKYKNLFKYILVDEYQDTNHAQYALLRLLADRDLFVVGDDAQAIYGFRGSNLRNILNFEQNFSDCLVVKLEQNYRSTKNILAVAQEVIEMNPEQKKKELWTENEQGRKIKVIEVEDEMEEAKFVAKAIIKSASGSGQNENESADTVDLTYEDSEGQDFSEEETIQAGRGYSILDVFLKKQSSKAQSNFAKRTASNPFFLAQLPKEHDSLNKYAVLYRTHAQSRALEEVFLQSQIPYQIIGGLKFYQRKEIKDLLAYLKLVLNFRDLVSLKRVINEPARGIGEKTYQALKNFILAAANPELGPTDLQKMRIVLAEIDLPPKQYNAVQDFFRLLEEYAQLDSNESLPSLMRLVLKKSGYENYLRDGSEEGESRWENIEELFNVASKYSNLPWQEGLNEFLEEVALMTEIDNMNDAKDCVTLMSLHQAKGLEFETVFFVGLEEGILPHSRSLLDPQELSEEIRLAYVGITRARKNLYLVYAQTRRMFGNIQSFAPSRILKVLPEDKIIFKSISRWSSDF